MAAKTYQRYPAMRYHKTLAPEGKEVKTAEAAAALGDGWVRTPAAFEPGYVEQPEPEDGSPIAEARPPGKPYVPYPILRYARNGEERLFGEAEDQARDPNIWKASPADWGAGAALPVPTAEEAAASIGESLYLLNAAEATAQEMQTLQRQGASWQEAWETVREQHLFPPAEADAAPMPEREGFRAHRDLMHALGSLTMPGEKEQPE